MRVGVPPPNLCDRPSVPRCGQELIEAQRNEELLAELQMYVHIGPHPNVVNLIGVCWREGRLCIVTEFMSGLLSPCLSLCLCLCLCLLCACITACYCVVRGLHPEPAVRQSAPVKGSLPVPAVVSVPGRRPNSRARQLPHS